MFATSASPDGGSEGASVGAAAALVAQSGVDGLAQRSVNPLRLLDRQVGVDATGRDAVGDASVRCGRSAEVGFAVDGEPDVRAIAADDS
jgi:hypothetical protein